MKNFGTNRIIKNLKNNYQYYLFFFLMTFLNIFFLYQNFSNNSLFVGKTFIILLITSILLEIVLCAIVLIAKKKNWKIEKTFLILGLIIGCLYVIALPVGRAPDEVSHFVRVYELSNGYFVSDTTEDGKAGSFEASNISIVQDFKEDNVTYYQLIDNLGMYPDNDDQQFITTSAYSYNIISYLPHVIGMFIGKTLGMPLLVTAYMAKLFNLIACIVILYFSIKYIPFLKNFIFFFAFFPITMQAMASLSADGLAIALSTALISFVLYSAYSLKTKFTKKHYALMLILCISVSLSKLAYAPLCLFLFAIPKQRFGSQKQKILSILATGAITFILLLGWLLIAPSLESVSDSSIQTASIFSDPIKYIGIVLNSLSNNATLYLSGFLGGFLEWFNVNLSPLYIIPSFALLVLICAQESRNIFISKTIKYLSISLLLFILIITFTTMYIQWTKVGENIIDGVQGRYFLPLALLIPLAFSSVKKPQKSTSQSPSTNNHSTYLYSFIVFESIYAITTIICTHI